MEDLMQKLQQVLGTSEGQQALNAVASMLANADSTTPAPSESKSPNLSALATLLSGNADADASPKDERQGMDGSTVSNLLAALSPNTEQHGHRRETYQIPTFDGVDMAKLLKIAKLVSQATKKDDKNTALIRAIEPHLRPQRRNKINDVIRLMQLMSMLPVLTESGLLNFGGDSHR